MLIRYLRMVADNPAGSVVDRDERTAQWFIDHGIAEPAPPELEAWATGKAVTYKRPAKGRPRFTPPPPGSAA